MTPAPPALPAPPDIIVYGTVCLDRFVAVDASGVPMSWLSETRRTLPGGEAFNTAIALAGWGVSVALTGTATGADPEGRQLCELLDDPDLLLDLRYLPRVAPAVTPVCTIRVFPDGERRMRGRGFAQAVAPPPLPDDLLRARPIFAVDPALGEAAIRQLRAAADAGCPVVAMDFAHRPDVVRASRILVTSRDVLTRDAPSAFDPAATAQRLCDTGAQTAIVTVGADGCWVADRDDGRFHVPVVSVYPIVDTTGAGDTFRAGLCFGLLQRWPLAMVVRFASAAAALHCQVWGGGSRISREHVLQAAGLPGR